MSDEFPYCKQQYDLLLWRRGGSDATRTPSGHASIASRNGNPFTRVIHRTRDDLLDSSAYAARSEST